MQLTVTLKLPEKIAIWVAILHLSKSHDSFCEMDKVHLLNLPVGNISLCATQPMKTGPAKNVRTGREEITRYGKREIQQKVLSFHKSEKLPFCTCCSHANHGDKVNARGIKSCSNIRTYLQNAIARDAIFLTGGRKTFVLLKYGNLGLLQRFSSH